MALEEEFSLLDNNYGVEDKKKTRKRKIINIILMIITIASSVEITYYTTYQSTKNKLFHNIENININSNKTIINGFAPVDNNNPDGPITVDKSKDDGNKIVIADKILNISDNKLETFYYNYDTFNQLDKKKDMEDEYLCETVGLKKEYYLSCPTYYHLIIDDAYYGRRKNDKEHCIVDTDGNNVPEDKLKYDGKCEKDFTATVKETCEGRSTCRLVPGLSELRHPCIKIYKYLHVKYHCEKDKEIKKPQFKIVMFANSVAPNSIFENAISEFYQYSKVHGYHFYFNDKRYDNERCAYYNKLDSLIEAVIYGLKTNEYDWVLWVDGDVILANPNIKLETFVPDDNQVHYIASADGTGLNNGIFLIRVHSWTLNFLYRSMAYLYNNKDKDLYFTDQASVNNVLVNDHEEAHYIIVPQHWFNHYPKVKTAGDFIIHFAGGISYKTEEARDIRKEIYNDPNWQLSRTNKKMRAEVLEFYKKYAENRRILKLQD